MSDVLDFVTVPRPDGHSLEVRRAPEEGADPDARPVVYGTVRVTELGWVAHAANGISYGPFATMGEAAYPLALAGEGENAAPLLGPPLPGGRVPRRAPAAPVAPPARSRVNRIIAIALLAVAVAAVVAERRIKA
jgi:hypothetical protein